MSSIARKITTFTQKEIDYSFNNARRVFKNKELTILASPHTSNFAKILIITSRKVGNAPERNKIRRRLKSIFYEEKIFKGDYNFIIIVYKNAIDLSFEQLKNILCKTHNNISNPELPHVIHQ